MCRIVIENCVMLNRGCMHDPRADALFGPMVLSQLLGMFELNCLGVTVESPVEDVADELRAALKRAAGGTDSARTAELRNAKALLARLGSVDMPCEVLTFVSKTAMHMSHMLLLACTIGFRNFVCAAGLQKGGAWHALF